MALYFKGMPNSIDFYKRFFLQAYPGRIISMLSPKTEFRSCLTTGRTIADLSEGKHGLLREKMV